MGETVPEVVAGASAAAGEEFCCGSGTMLSSGEVSDAANKAWMKDCGDSPDDLPVALL